ncbi:glutathione S-transferase family protein [Thiohalocapsa sp. ML1]|jgi:glutathionyl-hydroquinone reductase|uniref:glutathione S-transferase family protein n=1 Tax=Thiohalocapsa sp. ML1 TaxID=1431688 RepID=UPI0007320193|nr:glutathione S-transferase family protein [Thiohalocapsa sp. ML1]
MKTNRNGEFVRWESGFRNWVTPDGSPGPSGDGGFRAEPGRYHLYVSYACPWAHRTLIVRALKGLEDLISVSVVHPVMPPESWVFGDYPGATPDPVHGYEKLHQLYAHAAPGFDGVVTVPVLYDKARDTIVNNESSEIIRMLNSAFDAFGRADLDLYPEALRTDIDAVNDLVYDNINNGVYRAGFATSQSAYEAAFDALFATLDELEARLATQRYLVGGRITEADWRLFTTLVRFDAVYHGHFKCNLRRIVDYPSLWAYTRELYQMPGVAETVRMDHIKLHYYASHTAINPTGIVPKGPALDFLAPHGRAARRTDG